MIDAIRACGGNPDDHIRTSDEKVMTAMRALTKKLKRPVGEREIAREYGYNVHSVLERLRRKREAIQLPNKKWVPFVKHKSSDVS